MLFLGLVDKFDSIVDELLERVRIWFVIRFFYFGTIPTLLKDFDCFFVLGGLFDKFDSIPMLLVRGTVHLSV